MNNETYDEEDFFNMNIESFNADDGIINDTGEGADIVFDYNLLTALWNSGTVSTILIDQGLFETVSYTEKLSEITIPALLLWGKYDMVVPVTFGQQAFDNLGFNEKELVIFERSGHAPLASEPDLFAQKLVEFINENK